MTTGSPVLPMFMKIVTAAQGRTAGLRSDG